MKGTPEGNKPENQYESFYPSERFMQLADTLLSNSEEKTDGQTTLRMTEWLDPNTKDHYQLLRENRRIFMPMMGIWDTQNYRLIKYSPYSRNPKAPSEIYNCTHDGHMIHPIRKTDGSGNPIISFDQKKRSDAPREALEILAAKAPNEARRIMDDKFHERFRQSVGQYILSHLAYKDTEDGPMQSVNHDSVVDAVIRHAKRSLLIEEQVAKRSDLFINRDNAAKHEAVIDAIRSKPVRGRRDSEYRPVDNLESAMAVSKKLGGFWHRPYIKKPKQTPPSSPEDNA